MNSIHNNGPDDKQLDDHLENLGQAYKQQSNEEPPELLDQAILSSAHRAVESKDHWLDFGWIHGLTTAVVVVLAFSIILTLRQPTGLEENGLSPAASAPQIQSGSPAEPMAARTVRDDLRAKKALTSEDAPLEEEIMRVNTAAKATSAKPAVVGFADESGVTEIDDVENNAAKTDADKTSLERSQLTDEEAQLQAILMLKQAGDEKWKAELKTFIENNPDYALPDDLKN